MSRVIVTDNFEASVMSPLFKAAHVERERQSRVTTVRVTSRNRARVIGYAHCQHKAIGYVSHGIGKICDFLK